MWWISGDACWSVWSGSGFVEGESLTSVRLGFCLWTKCHLKSESARRIGSGSVFLVQGVVNAETESPDEDEEE